jgi:HK97 family phage portal protein
LSGNAYAKIIRRSGSGTAIALEGLLPQQVFVDRERDGQRRIVYVVKEDRQPDTTYAIERGKPQDILHIGGLGWDGMRGYSVITMGRQSIGTAIAGERNVARFWALGGRVPYHLELARKWATKEDAEKFREDWNAKHSNPNEAPMLPPDVTYHQDGLSMKDSQSLESRLFTVSEICRWFSVSPHLVADLSHATFSNIEHLALDFVKMTLSTWISRWEQEFWRCVLTADEKAAGYYLRHDLNALLRGDFKTRMEGYASALQNGEMCIDEARALEDRDPLPDGQGSHFHIQLNMQKVEDIGQESAAPAPAESTPVKLRRIV